MSLTAPQRSVLDLMDTYEGARIHFYPEDRYACLKYRDRDKKIRVRKIDVRTFEALLDRKEIRLSQKYAKHNTYRRRYQNPWGQL